MGGNDIVTTREREAMFICETVKTVKGYWPSIQDSVFLNTYIILIGCSSIAEIYAQLMGGPSASGICVSIFLHRLC